MGIGNGGDSRLAKQEAHHMLSWPRCCCFSLVPGFWGPAEHQGKVPTLALSAVFIAAVLRATDHNTLKATCI